MTTFAFVVILLGQVFALDTGLSQEDCASLVAQYPITEDVESVGCEVE